MDDDGVIRRILEADPARFGRVLASAEEHRLQILFTEVVAGEGGGPSLHRHAFRAGAEYFYPASAVKLCGAIAALQKVARLRRGAAGAGAEACGITSPLTYRPCFEGEAAVRDDPSNLGGGRVTVAHDIRKVFLVSDNPAFNRMFAFAGHRAINESMWAAGLHGTRLHHRLSASAHYLTVEQNRRCPDVEIEDPCGGVHTLPGEDSTLVLEHNRGLRGWEVGRGWVGSDGEVVPAPMDMGEKNSMPLVELQDLLVKLFLPTLQPPGSPGVELDEDHRLFLLDAMAQCPTQSHSPAYDPNVYFAGWNKFFAPGLERVRDRRCWRVYNKMGQAYGFTIDNAFIVDVESGRSFFLTAAIYTNANGILNDDQYEYESVAEPFLADLAEAVAAEVVGREAAGGEGEGPGGGGEGAEVAHDGAGRRRRLRGCGIM